MNWDPDRQIKKVTHAYGFSFKVTELAEACGGGLPGFCIELKGPLWRIHINDSTPPLPLPSQACVRRYSGLQVPVAYL